MREKRPMAKSPVVRAEEGIKVPVMKPGVPEETGMAEVAIPERTAVERPRVERRAKPERHRHAYARHERIIQKRIVERVVENRVVDRQIPEARRPAVVDVNIGAAVRTVIPAVVVATVIVRVDLPLAVVFHRGELRVTPRQARHCDEHRHNSGDVPEETGSSFR